MDGKVDAQPLYLSNVKIPGQGAHPVLYVATEHGKPLSFDANKRLGLWKVSLMGPGERTSDSRGCDEAINPEIGMTATPVIDRTQGPHGAIYVVAMSRDTAGNYFQRLENGYSATLHAYDATDLSKELYNSNQAPFVQDQLGPGNKFITPTIANGRVYVGTTYGVAVFGLR